MPNLRETRGVFLTLVVASLLMPAPAWSADEPISVGSKKFTESVILGEIVVGLIESTGRKATHRSQLGGTRVAWKALKQGEIDLYPEYSGTIRQEIFPDQKLQGRDALRKALAEKGIVMSEPLGFNNTYALGMKREDAKNLGIQQISDLKGHPDLVFGFSNEFTDRKDGWPGVKKYYGFESRNIQGMDHELAYRGLEADDVDVVDLYSTDAAIEYHDLRVLEDDRGFFPDYQSVLLYREGLEKTAPKAVEAFLSLQGKISATEMAGMNKAVKIDDRVEGDVAAGFLDRTFGISRKVEVERIWERVGWRTLEHLFMVVISMIAAIAMAIPLGIWAAKRPKLGQSILGAVGILQTIPSLALLVVMIPLFGIGYGPAIAALFLYSLLPIVRSTYSGLKGISDDILESARALGLEESAILRLVEVPMAMRSILAGIKISVVWNIGVATLGALVGAGGYGQPILTGIRRYDMGLILEGAIPAAVMAIGAQLLFEAVEKRVVSPGLRQQSN